MVLLLPLFFELNGLLARLSRFNCVRFDPGDSECVDILANVRSIDANYHSQACLREALVYAGLLELFAHIGRVFIHSGAVDPAVETNTEHANMKLMAQACLFISENCVKPLTLNEVASQVGVS